MNNNNISLEFYHYLCRVIGTESVVNKRRHILTSFDHINSESLMTVTTSGSKAEGLDLSASDFDIMCILNKLEVSENMNSVKQSLESVPFVMDTTDCKPGFTRIKQYSNDIEYKRWYEYIAGVSYFSSSMLIEDMLIRQPGDIIHGPSISIADGLFDMVMCLRCKNWISQAYPWILRSQNSWASTNVINAIIHFGVLFVPVGCKNSPNKDLEWRISFSYAEKLLIWSFNHVQLLCYALLKILLNMLKENIEESTADLLCSYFLKTVMFWICEETRSSQWQATSLISCFMNCLDRLIYCVKYQTCVHYFIPENDLFAGRFNDQEHSLLLSSLNEIKKIGWTCLLHTDTLMSFGGMLIQNQSTLICKISYLPSLHFVRKLSDDLHDNCIQQLVYFVYMCMRLNKKDLPIYTISVINKYISEHFYSEEKGCNNNKQSYHIYRKRVCHLLIGLNHDAVSGWLRLASLFYKKKQYHTCQKIVSDCLSRCTPDKILLTQDIPLEEQTRFNSLQGELGLRHLSLMRKYVIDRVTFVPWSNILPDEMTVLCKHGEWWNLVIPPVMYGLFLKFMCDHHLGNQRQKCESLRALDILVQNEYFINDEYDSKIINSLLRIAYSLR